MVRPAISSSARESWWLALIITLFLAWRVPLAYRLPGGVDEDWFAAPGWTIATSGIPRIPYAPSRDPQGFFYRADELLFALPPGYFYWQAPFHRIFGPSYGSARLSSLVAGGLAIWLLHAFGRRCFPERPAVALVGAGLYSLSRVCFLPASTVRPDMLCGTLGLASLVTLWHWTEQSVRGDRRAFRWLVATGLLLGLGGLVHPFAFVYSVVIALWWAWVSLTEPTRPDPAARPAVRSRALRGVRDFGLLAGTAIAIASSWGLLVVMAPELFERQFGQNVLHRHESSLWERLVWPWPAFNYHFGVLWAFAGPIQLALLGLGLIGVTTAAWLSLGRGARGADPADADRVRELQATDGPRGLRLCALLTWVSAVLLVVIQGTHPTAGYWCFPGSLLCLCLGWTVVWVGDRLPGRPWTCSAWVAGVALLMLPASGVRLWPEHLRHWTSESHSAPRLVARLLEELPPDARLLADRSWVFSLWVAGRDVTLGLNDARFFECAGLPYDYLILNPDQSRPELPRQLDAVLWRKFGDDANPFAFRMHVYRPREASGEVPSQP